MICPCMHCLLELIVSSATSTSILFISIDHRIIKNMSVIISGDYTGTDKVTNTEAIYPGALTCNQPM